MLVLSHSNTSYQYKFFVWRHRDWERVVPPIGSKFLNKERGQAFISGLFRNSAHNIHHS